MKKVLFLLVLISVPAFAKQEVVCAEDAQKLNTKLAVLERDNALIVVSQPSVSTAMTGEVTYHLGRQFNTIKTTTFICVTVNDRR